MRLAFFLASLMSGLTPAYAASDLICGGVEPFWALEIKGETALFTAPDTPDIAYDVQLRTVAEGRTSPVALTLIARTDTAIVILGERACGDTMSDTVFSHSVEVLTQRQSRAVMYTGCCRAVPE